MKQAIIGIKDLDKNLNLSAKHNIKRKQRQLRLEGVKRFATKIGKIFRKKRKEV
jgi:hypothetical protein